MTTTILIAVLLTAGYASRGSAASSRHGCRAARAGLVFYHQAAAGWASRHDASRPAPARALRSRSCGYVRWAARKWQIRARTARIDYRRWFDATYAKWACIHSNEGSWQDEDLPQMGGLQFDPGFQADYGSSFLARWGDAGHWPVWAQLLAAERAFNGYAGYGPRGYGPWPNTRLACGL